MTAGASGSTGCTPADPPTVAVTGAAGYIGSRVVWRLREAHPDWDLAALDNFYLGDVREVRGVAVEHVDVTDRGRLADALDGADVVLHLAAISGVDDCDAKPGLAHEVNVNGTSNVAWHCRRTGAALTFPISMAVLGDPGTFPITPDLPRDPMNWYGRTKLSGEHLVADTADGAFPAHTLLKSNLYGSHRVGDRRVSKGTVINFFVDRALSGEPLTVYEPGSQSRNFVHVDDVARAYVRSAERLLDQLAAGETGARLYGIASDEDPGVMAVARTVRELAAEIAGIDVGIELVENPRSGETLVEEFAVDTGRARADLGWEPTHTVRESVRDLLEAGTGEGD